MFGLYSTNTHTDAHAYGFVQNYSTPLCKSGWFIGYIHKLTTEWNKSYKNNVNSSTKVKQIKKFIFSPKYNAKCHFHL
jgi:hypothetical protein